MFISLKKAEKSHQKIARSFLIQLINDKLACVSIDTLINTESEKKLSIHFMTIDNQKKKKSIIIDW